jgi:5-methylcytosine-specific restriction enzyme subunit McrC
LISEVLVENGSWRPISVFLNANRYSEERLEREVRRTNRFLRMSLGLRQDPVELRRADNSTEIRVRGVAGTLSVGKLAIDVAPKYIPAADLEREWSRSLLMLVRHARPRHVAFQRSFQVSAERHSFIDLLAMAFADAVESGLQSGLIQTYQVREVSLTTIRGRLNIQRQTRSVFQRPHLLECDVDQLDPINPFNNLLKWASQVLASSVQGPGLKRRIGDLASRLPGTPNASLARRQRSIAPPPQFRIWGPALEIASLLSDGLAHSNQRGSLNGYSFVYNMERLFEHFVELSLKRVTTDRFKNQLQSHRQVSTLYAHPQPPTTLKFYSKPDNLLMEGEESLAVVDAKYKRLSDSDGLKLRKPQNQDVYELVAAMTAHQCRIGLLVYPKVVTDQVLNDDQLHVWHVETFGETLVIGAVALDLMLLGNPQGKDLIDRQLGESLQKLLYEQ